GSPRDGAAPQARGPRPPRHPHGARPGLSLRGGAAGGVIMSLTGRFSALFLAALGLSLIVFSPALYVAARGYLDHRLRARRGAARAGLAAAAEIHPDDVEWEPQERVLAPGQQSGPDRLSWMVLDERGRPIDRSANLAGSEGLAEGLARPEADGPD